MITIFYIKNRLSLELFKTIYLRQWAHNKAFLAERKKPRPVKSRKIPGAYAVRDAVITFIILIQKNNQLAPPALNIKAQL